jgi:hypothetical protein
VTAAVAAAALQTPHTYLQSLAQQQLQHQHHAQQQVVPLLQQLRRHY